MFDFFEGRIMDDVLDSRDVVDAVVSIMDDWGAYVAINTPHHDPLPPKDRALYNLECEGRATFGDQDWENGVTLIRDSYFTEYAQELADDLYGFHHRGYSWPVSHIDWHDAARALQQDYTMLEVDGVTWWGRA